MKKLFLTLAIAIAISPVAQAACRVGTFSVSGEFTKWEHPDYGWICSVVEESSGEHLFIENCAKSPFLTCRGNFTLVGEQKDYCSYEIIGEMCSQPGNDR